MRKRQAAVSKAQSDATDWKALGALGASTITALLKHFTGATAAIEVGKALSDYFARKYARRAREFSEQLAKGVQKARSVLDSSSAPEPLVNTFMTVFESCCRDDDDEKVRYYSAFMIGFAENEIWKKPKSRQLALVQAIKTLRVHDLWVLRLLAACLEHLRPSEGTIIREVRAPLEWLRSFAESDENYARAKDPVEFDVALQSLGAAPRLARSRASPSSSFCPRR